VDNKPAEQTQVATKISEATCGVDFTQCDSTYLVKLIASGITRQEYIYSAQECEDIIAKDPVSEGKLTTLTEELFQKAKYPSPKVRAFNMKILDILRGLPSVEGVPTRCFRMPCKHAGKLFQKLGLKDESTQSANNDNEQSLKHCYFFNEVESMMTLDKETDHTGHSMCEIPRFMFGKEHKLGPDDKCPPGYESFAEDDHQAQENACAQATSVCEGNAPVSHCTLSRAYIPGLDNGCFVASHGLQKHPFIGEANDACIFSSTSNKEFSLEKQGVKTEALLEHSQMVFTQLCKKTHSK
jgi:hypothetical protein